jgi:hypothetical protein
LPIPLDLDSTQQIPGLTNAYVYKGCQVILEERSSGMTTLSQRYEKRFEKACHDFESLGVKMTRVKLARLGGRRSASGGVWGGNYRPPIVG